MEDIGIVLINFNDAYNVNKVIKNYRKQKNVVVRICVVDNNSNIENYTKLLKNRNITIIRNDENYGYAKANNIGVRKLSEDGVEKFIISNNDIIIEDDFLLEKLLKNYNSIENVGIIAPIMLTVTGEINPAYAWRELSYKFDCLNSLYILRKFRNNNYYNISRQKEPLKVDIIPGSFFMVSIDIWNNISGFDERTFLYCEERILCEKIKLHKYKNYIISDLEYKHLESINIKKNVIRVNRYKIMTKSLIIYYINYTHFGHFKILFLKILRTLGIVEQSIINFLLRL